MIKRQKIISYLAFLLIIISGGLFFSDELGSWRWQAAAEAAGSMPYQIGLTKVVIVNCVVTPKGVCVGGTLCPIKAPGVCAGYADVSGFPAGGMGSNALFSLVAISQAGLTPGGQLIAGGMSPTEMDQGVLASAGGCYGCLVKDSAKDKVYAWLDRFIIAGFKD